MQSSGSQLQPVAAQPQQIQLLVVCIVVIVFELLVGVSAVVVVVVMFVKLAVFAVVVAVVPLLLVMVGELCVVLQSRAESSALPYTLYPQFVVVWISVVVLVVVSVVAVAHHSLTMVVVQVVVHVLVQSPLSSTVKVWFSLFRSRLLFVLLRHQ